MDVPFATRSALMVVTKNTPHDKRNVPQLKKTPEINDFRGLFVMDLAGIEPASESLSIQASPITVILFTFPPTDAG